MQPARERVSVLIGRTLGTWVTLSMGIVIGAANADVLAISPGKVAVLLLLLSGVDLTLRLLNRRFLG